LCEKSLSQSHKFNDYVGLKDGQRDKEFTFSTSLWSKPLKIWVNQSKKLTLKISTSFSDGIHHNGCAGEIIEHSIYNQTELNNFSSNLTITSGTSGIRRLHSEYLNGAVLLGAYKHRNIGIYCEGYEDEKDWQPKQKNSQMGLFLSFSDKNDKPCYAIITAKQLFKLVYGDVPENIVAGKNGSGLYAFDGSKPGAYD
jgi:hypothetical protein